MYATVITVKLQYSGVLQESDKMVGSKAKI